MSISGCFQNIIGLSRTPCTCFDYPADASTSDSGLFLDELEPLNSTLLKGREDYDRGELPDLMFNAREQAILRFDSDIVKELLKFNEFKRNFFQGAIGKAGFKNNLTINRNYAGQRWLCADVKDGYIHITNIRTIFDQTGHIDLMIWNNLGELINTYTLNIVADTYTDNVVNITLSLHSDYLDNLEYYFIYDATGLNPKDCQFNYICGWTTEKPCFTKAVKGWEAWIMAGGFSTDTLNFTDCPVTLTVNSYTNGLLFNAEMKCETLKIICRDELDFSMDSFAFKYAECVRLAAGELLVTSLLGSPEINRFTTMNRETLASCRTLFIEQYAEKMEWLGKNIDISKNDCLKCWEKTGFKKSTIWL